MEAGNFYYLMSPDTIKHTQGNIPVNNPFVISRPALSLIPGADDVQLSARQKFLNDQLKKQQWYKQVMYSRNKLLHEEQTLLVDSAYYINPRTEYYLVQMENLTHKLILPSWKINHTSTDWLTILIFLSLFLFTSVKYSFGKYLISLFQSITNYPTASRLFREQNISLKQGSSRLEILFLLVFSLFGYHLTKYFDMDFPFGKFLQFTTCFIVLGLFFLFKITAYSMIGFISETQAETSEFLFNMRNHNKILGVLLLPVVGFIAWGPVPLPFYSILAGLVITSIIYLLTLGRGVKILLKKQFSIFYLFLYLCTLEFLPLFVFFKVI